MQYNSMSMVCHKIYFNICKFKTKAFSCSFVLIKNVYFNVSVKYLSNFQRKKYICIYYAAAQSTIHAVTIEE